MNRRLTYLVRAMLVVVSLTLPRPAFADWLLTPYVGIVLSGAPNTINVDIFRHVFEHRSNFGCGLAVMGDGIFGLEIDLLYTPDFYTRTATRLQLSGIESRLTTAMANVVIGVPPTRTSRVGIRPYIAAGVGMFSANLREQNQGSNDFSTNHLAFDVGGGLHAFFSDRVGVRADLRYTRNLDRAERESFFSEDFGLPNFHYLNATVGVTFRFGTK